MQSYMRSVHHHHLRADVGWRGVGWGVMQYSYGLTMGARAGRGGGRLTVGGYLR